MGATRKLQGEIDRVLKKVQEGVDVFDSIWNKVYDTENANQKEKFEADLKKEIKKLQRYRDQIKTWIQSSEIKDKKALLDARKLIEREMERFKVCEKETKTKAFSKEGLGQQPKTDPREKAKGESRDWLNNMVSELESQIDSFEAEMEGLQVKKGKARPPRLTHLEESIARHKLHIIKLELILRLLDNDELSPDQVNDVKDFVEDYVERNQDDFEDFADVDELYQSLPLDKMEALEALDAIPNVPPAIVVKEKAAITAVTGVGPAPNGAILKPSIVVPVGQQAVAAVTATGVSPLVSPTSQLQVHEEGAIPEATLESPGARTPSVPVLASSPTSGVNPGAPVTGSGVSPVAAAVAAAASAAGTVILARGLGASTTVGILPGAVAGRSLTAKPTIATGALLLAQGSLLGRTKEEDGGGLSRRVGAGIGEVGLARGGVGRGAVGSGQSPPLVPLGVSGAPNPLVGGSNSGSIPPVLDLNKRMGLIGAEERSVTGGLTQQLTGSLGAQSRAFGATGGKLGESSSSTGEGAGVAEGGLGGRLFPPSGVSGGQWRPHSASTIQSQQAESGQYLGRPEIAPDHREKFLQRFQQVQGQLGSSVSNQIPHSGPSTKQPSVLQSQQPALPQQAQMQTLQAQTPIVSASPTASSQQQSSVGLATSAQAPSLPATTSSVSPAQPQGFPTQSSSQQLQHQLSLSSTTSSKENDAGSRAVEPPVRQPSPQLAKPLEETTSDASMLSSVFSRSVSLSEDDLKNADTFDVPVGGPGTLAELSQLSREVDFAPGQVVLPLQASTGPGVIGRKIGTELGAIGDNLSPTLGGGNAAAQHDQLFNRQALEAAYRNLPLPKDSERPKSYIPRNPAVTPGSYPQMQAPIVDNPALWERLDTDVLFFAFYYQQGTYQQYLAARELKKQSWRYHKKYNTWFQRHEEPKITTDEYEQGTYVYFDFHIVHDDFQQGWCQRIKTEFTFEYSYLEDELVV